MNKLSSWIATFVQTQRTVCLLALLTDRSEWPVPCTGAVLVSKGSLYPGSMLYLPVSAVTSQREMKTERIEQTKAEGHIFINIWVTQSCQTENEGLVS